MMRRLYTVLAFLGIVLVSGCVGQYSYEDCLADAEADEQEFQQCYMDGLVDLGHTDGIDCFEDEANPVCEDIDRYNAGVDAYNECADMVLITDCSDFE